MVIVYTDQARMAWTYRGGTRQEFRFALQFAESLRVFRYELHPSPYD